MAGTCKALGGVRVLRFAFLQTGRWAVKRTRGRDAMAVRGVRGGVVCPPEAIDLPVVVYYM
eukprot:COSAG06_NODE_263_length_18879_cov_71.911555_3_plen_61_part_00